MSQDIIDAYQRIKDYVNKTPVMTSRTLNELSSAHIYVKCENYQRIGAFKARGAFNAIKQLIEDSHPAGVITHSSGNHAQAVALAARELGVKALIIMPKNAPLVKKAATRGYGATIIECGNSPTDRVVKTKEVVEKYGYPLVHPYNDYKIIHGAGTAAYELLTEVGELDYVLAPVGGGGLLSGTSICVKSLFPDTIVIGIEPLNANDAYLSFKDGTKIYPSVNPKTIADGLRTNLGDITFKIIKENVDDIITVSEKQIISAMKFLWERMKIVVEPSGAVPLAGLFRLVNEEVKYKIKNKKIGLIISGGNIDLTDFFNTLSSLIED
ncbi:serine dehydratase [Candidatus Heimdallarchaeota archaeon B3_Heim]|nr:MAG: serine dehydratase [Candidatus Heimdallarchaeota archaeon B3_Heim]